MRRTRPALKALETIAAGDGPPAAEALVSMARLGHRSGRLSEALDAHDDYRRLNAALAVAYVGERAEEDRLLAMLREAASPTERVYLAAALAILTQPTGAVELHTELSAAASLLEFDKRLDIFFLHRFLQMAILDGLAASKADGAEFLKAWHAETEPLEPVPKPVAAEAKRKPTAVHEPRAEAKAKRQDSTSTVASETLNVFLSYSHRDEKMREKLGEHLAPLVDEGLIRIWHDREIEAGADWEGEINHEIAAADMILMLVSASFLNSRYCRKELQTSLQRRGTGKAVAIPIILRDCEWTSVFNTTQYKIQALPRDDRPVAGGSWPNHDAAYAAIEKELRAKAEKMRGRRQDG